MKTPQGGLFGGASSNVDQTNEEGDVNVTLVIADVNRRAIISEVLSSSDLNL